MRPAPAEHEGANCLRPDVFANPEARYRGVALWMLNDKIELDEAERQLRGFREAGWGAIITRTYMGTRITYLSEEWLALLERVLRVSREQGTTVFLQEADTKVGGYVTTALLGMEDRYRHHRLVMAPTGQAPPPQSALLATVGDDAFYDQMVVPRGAAREFFAVMDLLDEETVRAFMERCHQAQADYHGEDFGGVIEAIWMDEPFLRFYHDSPLPVLPWTPRLPELFQRDWGYSLLGHLPSLFREVGDFRRVRHQFWRTVVAQFKRAYWEPIGRWCGEHGVKFAGHLMGEDTLQDQIGWSGAIMPFYEDMQLPGIDYLTKDISAWRPRGSKFIITPKQCASVANQLGKREVLAEMYGVSDQGLTFEDRKWIAEWLAVLGINYRCYHAAFYSLRGCRKRMYPPHLGYQQPYWPENRRLADGMARLSYVMRQGRYAADVLVIHPLESAHCLYTPDPEQPALAAMDQELIRLSDNLLALHRGFDYGDEYLLAKHGRVENSALVVGEMAYRAVVLPGLITLRATTIRLLKQFLDAGGLVLSVGELPTRVDGAETSELRELTDRVIQIPNRAAALGQQLDRAVPASLSLEGQGTDQVWVHERRLRGQRVVFLVNTSRTQSAEGVLRMAGAGRLEAWDCVTGTQAPFAHWREGSQVCAALTFAPTQSHLLVLHEGEAAPETRPRRSRATRRVPLPSQFRLRRHHPNALTLDFCRYRAGEGDWSEVLPVIGVLEKLNRQRYQGPVELEYRFRADLRPAACALVVEDSDQCWVTLNGQPVILEGDRWYWDKGFHCLEAAPQVQRGENVVVVARDFRPPDPDAIRDHERFYGTDLEAIYVIGDFAVRGRRLGEFSLVPEPQTVSLDLVAAGYPFYAGTVTLSQELDLPAPEPGERVFLDLGQMQAAIAQVRVNGEQAGAILWPPYCAEIGGLLRPGPNQIELELTNTLKNLLGPHHYTGPHQQEVWQTHFTAMLEDPDWMDPERRGRLATWSDEYQFAPFGAAGECAVVYETND